jgi:crotonobetainyl-CoA:carnitine CoA-transferase CaiB-like acyl-CoA transferase
MARAMIVPMQHPLTDGLRLVASPIKLSETPVSYRLAPPLLGQHSQELLLEAGYSAEQIEALMAQGVVV